MAMRLDAGEVGRGDLFSIFPENLIVVEEENSRVVPHTDDEIEALAHSILEHTQQQAVVATRIAGNKVQLVSGYGHTTAIKYINTVLRPENPLKVLVRIQEMNKEEAFVRSIVENIDRAATTPIDDAHAQRRLREEFHWTEERIAKFYKKSVAYIGQLRKTLTLSNEIKQEVATGNLPISTAIALTELPEAERPAVLEAAKSPETGKVNSEVVNQAVRNQKIAAGGGKSRSVKEIRKFLEELTGPAEQDGVRELSKKLLAYIGGKITDQQMTNALKKWTRVADATAAAA
jgi:ParB/RepB/Spo0J family partition protein